MSSSRPQTIWAPSRDDGCNITAFLNLANERFGLKLRTYNDLHEWSTDLRTAEQFWLLLFEFLQIKSDRRPTYAIEKRGQSNLDLYPPPRFFPEVKLNFAENVFQWYSPGKVVLHVCTEGGQDIRDVTWDELRTQIQTVASAMVASGVGVGDRVAAVISNRLETIVCCLAALSLGAIWSTSSPDMGVDAVLGRLMQIRPKIVFCEAEVVYNGKRRDLREKIAGWAKQTCETKELVDIIVLGAKNESLDEKLKQVSWEKFLERATRRELTFERLPFSHPAFVVYSSGTSGQPKCIVHSAGGLLLQVRKDAILHYDIRPGDTVMQYTTTGWIMWSMVLVSLTYGGKVVVYDGSPFVPDELVLLRLVHRLNVRLFGTSAKFLTHLKSAKICPRDHIDLSSLRTVTSTGSTLTADVAEWFYDKGFPKHVHLHSTCGGTDLACSLITGNPTMPLYAGEIQCASLGMAVDVLSMDESAPTSVKRKGEPGELVCTRPFPSQPVFFWGEKSGNRYRESYFEKFGPEIWNQGDFVSVNPATGGYLVHGRSDGVLNPSGVRFGSAEIYNVVHELPEVLDSLCVGQRRRHDNDEHVVLFVRTHPGEFSRTLCQKIKSEIETRLSKRHVPRFIFETVDIPYTITGKKVETLVKSIISGKPFKVSPTVQNPECVAFYKQFVEIEQVEAQQSKQWLKAML